MATILHNGTRLAYEERGGGDPAFVFVHGWTCDRSFFAPQAEHFAQHHRVVSLDLRGHGESDKPQGHYPISAYADDIAYLIEQLAAPMNPPHLMSQWLPTVVNGWTLGAGHCNQLEAPDQVNAMIECFLRHYGLSVAPAGLT